MQFFNLLNTALESNENGNAQPEIEYTVYGKLVNGEDLNKASHSEKQIQANIDLENGNGVKLRIRQVGDDKWLLCAKKKNANDHDLEQTEVEMEITRDMFDILLSSVDKVFYKTRYFFPVDNHPELTWEVDVFTTPDGQKHPWIKLDLEVPDKHTARPPYPFDIEEAIDSPPSEFTEGQKKALDALWKQEWVTDISGKIN